MEEVPFAAGLQILFCDSLATGRKPRWTRDRTTESVDALASIEAALDAALKGHA
jgi:hypothetical protein